MSHSFISRVFEHTKNLYRTIALDKMMKQIQPSRWSLIPSWIIRLSMLCMMLGLLGPWGCGGFFYAECRTQSDCPSQNVCALGWCHPPGLATCGLDGSCAEGFVCSRGVCISDGSRKLCMPTVQDTTLSHGTSNQYLQIALEPTLGLLASIERKAHADGFDVLIRDIQSFAIRTAFFVQQKGLTQVLWSPKGDILLVFEHFAELREPKTGRVLRTFKALQDPIVQVAFSPNSDRLALASKQQLVVEPTKPIELPLKSLQLKPDRLHMMQWLQNSQKILISNARSVTLWNVQTASVEVQHTLEGVHSEGLDAAFLNPKHSELIGYDRSGTLSVWSTQTGKRIEHLEDRTCLTHTVGPWHIAFFAQRKWVALSSKHKTCIWDRTQKRLLATLPVSEPVFSLPARSAFITSSGHLARVAGSKLELWSIEPVKLQRTIRLDRFAGAKPMLLGSVLDSHSKRVVLAFGAGSMMSWDVVEKEHQTTLEFASTAHWGTSMHSFQLAFSIDGKHLTSISDALTVRRWRCNKKTYTYALEERFSWSSEHKSWLSPDGRWIGVLQPRTVKQKNNIFRIWDVQKRVWTAPLYTGQEDIAHVAFQKGHRIVALAFRDSWRIELWDIETSQHIQQIDAYTQSKRGRTRSIQGIALSPSGQHLLVACHQEQYGLELWNIKSKKVEPLSNDAGFDKGFKKVRFSPNGKWFAVIAQSNYAYIFDAQTGLRRFKFKFDGVLDVAFRFDNRVVICIGLDGRALAWNLETGKRVLSMLIPGVRTARPIRVAFHPNGTTIAIGLQDGLIRLWNCP